MLCEKCGKEIKENVKFCPYCGFSTRKNDTMGKEVNQLSDPEVKKSEDHSNNKKVMVIVIIVVVITVAVIIGIVSGYYNNNYTDNRAIKEETQTNISHSSQFTQKEETENNSEDVYENSESEQTSLLSKFSIDENQNTSYLNALNPQDYLYYDSGISDFGFYYPADLFCNVEEQQDEFRTDYGENLDSIEFLGNDGTWLNFEIAKRSDDISDKQMFEKITEKELQKGYSSLTPKKQQNIVVMTGVLEDDEILYKMIRIETDYILTFEFHTPKYIDTEDKNMKQYVTECIYKLCDFNSRDVKIRTYEEFCEG